MVTEEKLLSVLETFLEKDENSSVCITVDESNELQTLYNQTGKMKQVISNFPDSLMLDCAYKVNMPHAAETSLPQMIQSAA